MELNNDPSKVGWIHDDEERESLKQLSTKRFADPAKPAWFGFVDTVQ